MKSDINIPFHLSYDRSTGMFDMIMKTVMRKKSFLTSNVTLDVNSHQILEMRDKTLYNEMRPFFDKTPEYVFRELYFAKDGFFKEEFAKMIADKEDDEEIEMTFMEWIDLEWNKKVIEVNIKDFTANTQRSLKSRGMGTNSIKEVPSDELRNSTQREIASKIKPGKNEPVILLKTSRGYNLIEGWHRTMSILSLGTDGTQNYEDWDKVKLNAWIATGEYTDELSDNFGTFH